MIEEFEDVLIDLYAGWAFVLCELITIAIPIWKVHGSYNSLQGKKITLENLCSTQFYFIALI